MIRVICMGSMGAIIMGTIRFIKGTLMVVKMWTSRVIVAISKGTTGFINIRTIGVIYRGIIGVIRVITMVMPLVGSSHEYFF